MKTAWGEFRDFINSKEIGYIFTRQKLHDQLGNLSPATIDSYRSLIQQAKFIERIGRGQYKLIDHLPEGLAMGALFALLRGDNLTYVEEIQNQKEFQIRKEQFLQERRGVINRLLRDSKPLVDEAATIEFSAFGLKQVRRNLRWELNKTPNPTKKWLLKH